jgi:predicted MFS family arabinose efflux permease
MPKVFTIEGVILLLLPFALFNRITGLLVLMALGVCMYLHNSPVQMHFLAVAEADYPQSMVMASSLNSIFANFGIALGSATGGLVVDHFGLAATGFGGAIYLTITLVVVIWLNRINQQHQQSH